MKIEKKVSLSTTAALCGLAAVTGAICCYAALEWSTPEIRMKLRLIDKLVNERYVGEIDGKKVADYAAIGYLASIDDPWSAYIPAEDYESYHLNNEGMNCGIGVTIITRSDSIRVRSVYDDSPAQKAGIERGDYILGAEDLTVEKDGADAVINAIHGAEGTTVRVSIQKAGTNIVEEHTMTRELHTQKIAWSEMKENNVGYLRLENFHAGAAEQFQTAFDQLVQDGVQALVIDVRHNGGGRVQEMKDILDPLLPEGTIMTLTTKDGENTVFSSDANQTDLPVVVLIDSQSISAAEFFAAALQEYNRATLVGTHTTGKGRAQQTFLLPDGSAVNLSVEQYYTPKGNNLAGVGIAPDVEVPLSQEQSADFYFLGEEDPQLQKALELARNAIITAK